MPSQIITDAAIQHQLDMMRLDAGTRAEVRKLLEALQRTIVAALSDGPDATEWSRARQEQLLAEINQAIRGTYVRVEAVTADALSGAGRVVAEQTAAAIVSALPAVRAVLPPDTFLATLMDAALVQGAPASAWWAKQSEDLQFRLAGTIREGLAAGADTQSIIRGIVGTRGTPGIMEIARRNAAAVVQTSAASVANAARFATFEANSDIIKAYKWLTALDGHVCPQCAARADLTWANEPGFPPVGHKIPFARPPIHFNDRCILTAVTRTYKEMGIDLPEPTPSDTGRASSKGPVPSGTTLADFLERKGAAYADDVLGPGRAKLWKDGRITLQQLVNGDGRPLSLDELQRKYG